MTNDPSAPRARDLKGNAENRIVFGATVEACLELSAVLRAPGHVALSAPLSTDKADPVHAVDPVRLSVLADAAAGLGILTASKCESGATAELRVDILGAPAVGATSLEAVGTSLVVESGIGTSRVDIHDNTGAPIAHAVAIMAVDLQHTGAPKTGPGAVDVQFDPADVRVSALGTGEWIAVLTPGMSNSRGIVHGGVLMGLAHAAQDAFEEALGGRFRRVRLTVDYLRPAPPQGVLRLRSTVERSGRRLRAIRTELVREDGKVAAVATGVGAPLTEAGTVAA